VLKIKPMAWRRLGKRSTKEQQSSPPRAHFCSRAAFPGHPSPILSVTFWPPSPGGAHALHFLAHLLSLCPPMTTSAPLVGPVCALCPVIQNSPAPLVAVKWRKYQVCARLFAGAHCGSLPKDRRGFAHPTEILWAVLLGANLKINPVGR
jgi:hypothetical protein